MQRPFVIKSPYFCIKLGIHGVAMLVFLRLEHSFGQSNILVVLISKTFVTRRSFCLYFIKHRTFLNDIHLCIYSRTSTVSNNFGICTGQPKVSFILTRNASKTKGSPCTKNTFSGKFSTSLSQLSNSPWSA